MQDSRAEEMNPSDLKLRSGIPCLSVDEEAHSIGVIVPEGWSVLVMTSDSGQVLRAEPKATERQKAISPWPGALLIRPTRAEPAPTFGVDCQALAERIAKRDGLSINDARYKVAKMGDAGRLQALRELGPAEE